MKVNILISFAYKQAFFSKEFRAIRPRAKVLMDSGAFTAMNSGKPVVLSDYHDFISENPEKFDEYIQLDVIGNHKATKENLEQSLKEGFNPIPVFTPGAPIEEYTRLVTEVSPRICIGGIAIHGGDEYLERLFSNIPKKYWGEAHLLGYTALRVLGAYRPTSADTASWSGSIRFSGIQLWDGRQHFSVEKKWFQRPEFQHKMTGKITSVLRKYGIDYRALRNPKEFRVVKGKPTPLAVKLTIRSELQKMIDVKKYFGTDYYLAVADAQGLKWVLDELDFFKGAFE